jgi:hypothetical protein
MIGVMRRVADRIARALAVAIIGGIALLASVLVYMSWEHSAP